MFAWVVNLVRVPELRRRLLFTGAVAPCLFTHHAHLSQATSRALGGTSVLIVVGVALDTVRQMESQMTLRRHEGFLKR